MNRDVLLPPNEDNFRQLWIVQVDHFEFFIDNALGIWRMGFVKSIEKL